MEAPLCRGWQRASVKAATDHVKQLQEGEPGGSQGRSKKAKTGGASGRSKGGKKSDGTKGGGGNGGGGGGEDEDTKAASFAAAVDDLEAKVAEAKAAGAKAEEVSLLLINQLHLLMQHPRSEFIRPRVNISTPWITINQS